MDPARSAAAFARNDWICICFCPRVSHGATTPDGRDVGIGEGQCGGRYGHDRCPRECLAFRPINPTPPEVDPAHVCEPAYRDPYVGGVALRCRDGHYFRADADATNLPEWAPWWRQWDTVAGCIVDLVSGPAVEVGDVLVFLSKTFRIDRIEPYRPSDAPAARELYERIGGARARVAHAGPRFAITLEGNDLREYAILPRPERP